MTAPPAFVLAIMEAMEQAEMPPAPLSTIQLFADRLVDIYPKPAEERVPWTRWTEERYAELTRRFAAGEKPRDICTAMGITKGQLNGAITRLHLRREEPE